MIITPRNVIEEREWYLAQLFSDDSQIDSEDLFFDWNIHNILVQPRTPDLPKQQYKELFRAATVTIWESRIFDIATEGAEETFAYQRTAPEFEYFSLWFFKDRGFVFDDEYFWRQFHLAKNTRYIVPFFLIMYLNKTFNMLLPFCVSGTSGSKLSLRWVHSGENTVISDHPVEGIGTVDPISADFIAASLFLKTKIADVRTEVKNPRITKHWSRRNISVPEIKVVHLRGFETIENSSNEGASGREFSHRWLVRPHWRNQRVGPQLMQQRQTFIGQHIKGPKDKPLISKETIFVAKR